MSIEKVLDLWVQLMKNGGKNKSVAFIILFSVHGFFSNIIYIYYIIKYYVCLDYALVIIQTLPNDDNKKK